MHPSARSFHRDDTPLPIGGYLAEFVRFTLAKDGIRIDASLVAPATATAGDAFTTVDELERGLRDQRYVAERGLATTLFLTLKLGKPLLLEGEAGVGKTEIAKVLADVLQTPLIRLQCYEVSTRPAIYEWDYPRQMLYLRTVEAGGESRQAVRHDLFSEEFLLKRPLLQAIDAAHERAPVLLIDEVDRADQELEAFLLELLSDFQVTPRDRHHPRRARPGGDPHLQPHARDP